MPNSNLPPGVTASGIDRHYGGGVSDHEHEWEAIQDLSPVVEDMAAIFHEQCMWVEILNSYTDKQRDEVYYEEGAECEAERSYRFELAYVKHIHEDDSDHTYHRGLLDRLEEENPERWEDLLEPEYEVARKFNQEDEEVEVISIDPDRETGEVVLRLGNYEVGYGPGVMRDDE